MKNHIILILIGFLLSPARPLAAGADVGANALNDKLNHLVSRMEKLNKNQHAQLLSPEFFKKFSRETDDARDLIKEGGKLRRINDSLTDLAHMLEKVKKNVEQGRMTYEDILKKREMLLLWYESGPFLKELEWADREIRDGGEEIEDGDLKDAKKQQEDIVEALFKAEVAGAMNFYMKGIKHIESSIDDSTARNYMGKNLKEVKRCKSDLKEYIKKNPGDHEGIKQRMSNCGDRWHRFQARLLFAEKSIGARWDKEDLVIYIDTRLDELITAKRMEAANTFTIPDKMDLLRRYITEDTTTLNTLREKIQETETRLTEKEGEIAQLQAIEGERKKFIHTYRELSSMYTNHIALVKTENRDIVIDMYGLTFKPGSFEITSKAFPLLEKIKKSVSLFKENKIEIIGHTDSLGNAVSNKLLSKQRAKTVSTYILSTGVISSDKVIVLGRGDAKPLRPNTTKENRKKNRRVEIRIKDVVL